MQGDGKASRDVQKDNKSQPGHKRKSISEENPEAQNEYKVWKWDIVDHAWKTPSSLV